MQLDNVQFMNLVMEKTNNKLNELQARVIVLEAQLQLAVEVNKELKDSLDKQERINKKKDVKSDY
jgi:type II secretory pathway component PulJ